MRNTNRTPDAGCPCYRIGMAPADMDELPKIIFSGVVGAFSGFIVGILAEPIKIWFRNANDRARLRNLLYRDLALIYEDMVWLKYRTLSGEEIFEGNLQTASDRRDAAQRDAV